MAINISHNVVATKPKQLSTYEELAVKQVEL